jgi:hypothetical protein
MARIPASPYPTECRYRCYVVFDRPYDFERDISHGDDVIYGIIKIPLPSAFTGRFEFYNDTSGLIGLLIREVSEAEWGTYQAFELFPILHVASTTCELHKDYSSGQETQVLIHKVHFNDH